MWYRTVRTEVKLRIRPRPHEIAKYHELKYSSNRTRTKTRWSQNLVDVPEEVFNVHYHRHSLGMGQRFYTMPEITRSMGQSIYISQILYLSSFPTDYDLTIFFINRQRRFPHFGDVSIRRPFEDKNYNISNKRILHVQKTRFFSFFWSYLFLYLLSNIYFILICSQRRDNT